MKKNIVLDTDIGTDSDDIGALAILCHLAHQQKIRLSAVTSCSSTLEPVYAIDLIAQCYGIDLPIGKSEKPYGDDAAHGDYARKICEVYHSRLVGQDVPSAVSVLRRALVQGNVTLVTIGPLNNIADLLCSPPDDISPLNGKQLFCQSVTEMYTMAGTFENHWVEWNVAENVGAFRKVLDEVSCPITFVPFEVGVKVKTAANFLNGDDCPMKFGYYVHNHGPRESWDPITAYCAAVECLPTTDWGQITADSHGITTYQCGRGNRRYLRSDFDGMAVTEKLEKLMVKI